MVTIRDLTNAINELIIKSYPNSTIYIKDCPKDFDRNSFWLEYVRLSQTDASRHTVEKTVYFSITCFAPVDKYFRAEPDELSGIHDNILSLFEKGYVKVKDRFIKVKSSTGGIDLDRAYIDLQFEFFDTRSDVSEELPLIASVHTKIKEG